jgi:hypothetical protein
MKKNLAALAATAAVVLLAMVVGEAPASAGTGAGYGAHVSGHARAEGGFSGVMNPGDHRGFAGFDEHHH